LLLENVAALLNRGLVDVLGTLASIGYDAEWHCLQAADFGAPHLRDRVFILGDSKGNLRQTPRHEMHNPFDGASAAVADASRIYAQGLYNELREGKFGGGGWWATEPKLGRVADGIPARVDRLRGLGNAVVPQIAEWLGRQIMEADS
tara:strand:- start:98 stop:538 length:441 start_codon:yes stop_codon:yes gene_type:complete